MVKPKYCYGCKDLDKKVLGCGGIEYGCKLRPGLVIGESAGYEPVDDEPRACVKYEKE